MGKDIDNYKQPMEITRLKNELFEKNKKEKELKEKLVQAYESKNWQLVAEVVEEFDSLI